MNANQIAIINAIAFGATSSKEIAEVAELKVTVVTGSSAALKKNGLVEINDGVWSLTEEGQKHVEKKEGVVADDEKVNSDEQLVNNEEVVENQEVKDEQKEPKKPTKAELCRAIFNENPDAPRADLMKRFQEEVGLSKKGSNTYIHNLRVAHRKTQESQEQK